VVPDVLRSWVAGIDMAAAAGTAAVDVPDHATTLVVRTAPGARRELVVMGPRTRATYHVAEPGPSCVRIRMQPGRARALLGRPVRDLVDRALPLADLRGLDPDRVAEDPVEALVEVLGELSTGQDVIAKATRFLADGNVADAARRLHVSERQLRALFADGIGLSPKHFARIDRVRSVLAAGHERRWADVAAAAGYYDQSHMTAEFRHLMGVPPGAFVAGRRPVARRCG
jgi:AraC-like DNA-binding protein